MTRKTGLIVLGYYEARNKTTPKKPAPSSTCSAMDAINLGQAMVEPSETVQSNVGTPRRVMVQIHEPIIH